MKIRMPQNTTVGAIHDILNVKESLRRFEDLCQLATVLGMNAKNVKTLMTVAIVTHVSSNTLPPHFFYRLIVTTVDLPSGAS